MFDIDSNGGFTTVALIKFGGEPVAWERVFDLHNAYPGDNIILSRYNATSGLIMRILNGANWASECRIALPGSITQGNWLEITTRYQASSGVLDLRVGDSYTSTTCTVKQQNRAFTHKFIGKSRWANDLFFHGSIAGFFAVDAYLHTTQMQAAMLAMQTNQDILVQATCKACPTNTESAVGSASVADCECISGSLGVCGLVCMMGCDAGSSAVQDGITGDFTCVACDFGKFKSVFGTTACVDYDAGKFRNSTGAINQCLSCNALQYSAAAAPKCEMCPLNARLWANGVTCACDDGYVGHGINAVCEPCALRFYRHYVRANICLRCLNPFSTTLNLATSSRYDCVCGRGYGGWDARMVCIGDTCTTSEITNNQCTACVPGKYKDYAGAESCQQCVAGSTSLVPAGPTAADCMCDAGFTGADPTACMPCAAGTYKDTPGSQSCTSCAENTNSNTQSSMAADCQCIAGWFEDTHATSEFALTIDNFNTLVIEVSRLGPVVLTWPGSTHPVGITNNRSTLQEVVGLTVYYNVPNGHTTFTIPNLLDGPLYYFCITHASMGVHEIVIKSATCAPCAIGAYNTIVGLPTCAPCRATTSSLAQSDAHRLHM